jgi:hypothetical protein
MPFTQSFPSPLDLKMFRRAWTGVGAVGKSRGEFLAPRQRMCGVEGSLLEPVLNFEFFSQKKRKERRRKIKLIALYCVLPKTIFSYGVLLFALPWWLEVHNGIKAILQL